MNLQPVNQLHRARILVVEDHPFLREGIVRLLNLQRDLICCGQADSLASTLTEVARAKPDLVLMDLHLKDGDGFQLIEFLRPQFPDLLILVLSHSTDVAYVQRALLAGANGYVIKEDTTEVLNAIRALLLGKAYVSEELAGQMVPKFPNRRSLQ